MTEQQAQRKRGPDRRVSRAAEFPLQDGQGNWIVTDRRKGDRRASDREAAAHARLMVYVRVLLVVLVVVVMPVVLIRAGIITAPPWLPLWVLYPELFIQRLIGTTGG